MLQNAVEAKLVRLGLQGLISLLTVVTFMRYYFTHCNVHVQLFYHIVNVHFGHLLHFA